MMETQEVAADVYRRHRKSMGALQMTSADDLVDCASALPALPPQWHAALDALMAAENDDATRDTLIGAVAALTLSAPPPAPSTSVSHSPVSAMTPLTQPPEQPSDADGVRFTPQFGDVIRLMTTWAQRRGGPQYVQEHLPYVIDCLFASPKLQLNLTSERLNELFFFVCQHRHRPALERLNFWLNERIDPLQHWVHTDFLGSRVARDMRLYNSLTLRVPIARRTLYFGALNDSRLLLLTARQDVNWLYLDPDYQRDGKALDPYDPEDEARVRVTHVRGYLLEAPPPEHPAAQLLRVSYGAPTDTLSATQKLFVRANPTDTPALPPLFALKLDLSQPRGVVLNEAMRIERVLPHAQDEASCLPPDASVQASGEALAAPGERTGSVQGDERARGVLFRTQVGNGLFLEPMRLPHTHQPTALGWFKPRRAYSQALRRLPQDLFGSLIELAPWGPEVALEMQRAASWSSL